MQSLSRRVLSDSHVVQIYEWAEHSPQAVLKCTCRQVRRIKTLPSFSHALGGQDVFLHHETPAINAEVCGMLVGVTPKENQVIYQVDDGTAVLRVIETRKSLRQAESRLHPAASSAMIPSGVPECYIMPPQSKVSSSAQGLDNHSAAPMLAPLNPRFEVADIVQCLGRIQIDRSGDRYLALKSMDMCIDINAEALHQIGVVRLENDLYRQPFDLGRMEAHSTTSDHSAPSRKAHAKTSVRQLISELSQNEQSTPAMVADDADESQQNRTGGQRLSRDEARRLLSRNGPFSSSPAESESITPAKSLNDSSQPRSSRYSARKLRTHDKIADHKLSESYFQLQLQQHISLRHHSDSFTLSDLSSDGNLAALAGRLVRLRLQSRKSSRSSDRPRQIDKGETSRNISEQPADKVKRLFEWAIRKMMRDGFITLSDSEQLGFTASAAVGLRSHDVESYRLVTPEYLLQPLRKLLGTSTKSKPLEDTACDIDDLTTRLRILDDRFRFVSRSIVQESLNMYNARYLPIVID
ncbi:uncharacterized protein UDID_02356 [Ustilago sp. UG-2017a]|nr:uncharacterized protein UDID_02356 [Ustilago sp. UG-2017a]